MNSSTDHGYMAKLKRSVFLFLLIFFLFSKLAVADDNLNGKLTIKVGAYENNPKIYTDNHGKVVGLFPDVLSHIAKKEGWEIKWVHGTWSECLDRLSQGKIDLMVDVAYSEERAKKYNFTKEIILVNWAVVYIGHSAEIQSLMDLKGKKIAVMKDSIHTEGTDGIKNLAEKFDIKCSFIEVDSYKKVFELVSKGEADAGVVNRLFGSLFSQSYNVKKTSIIFNPRHLRFACPKNSPLSQLLTEKIDRHLYLMKKDPDSIYNRAVSVYLSGMPRELIFQLLKDESKKERLLLTPDEKRWIEEHPSIRLGIDPEFAPFEYLSQNGNYEGIASDYINLLNKRLGTNMHVVQNTSWKDAVKKAMDKEIDVLPCVGITQERTNYMIFSKPYINFYRVIITRYDKPFLSGIEDIEGLKVAVQENSSHEGYLKENTSVVPITFKTLQQSLKAVSDGKADAFVGNLTSSTFWIRKLNLTNLKVAASVSEGAQKLHFAVRDDWPELVKILNKGLASISQDEENKIQKKWINIEYNPGISSRDFWTYVSRIAVIIIVIFIVIMFWNYRLKKEIQKRIEIENKLFEANKNLKALDRLKSMFIASMSHELRTPLNSIIGFTGVILQEMTGPLNEKQKDHLSRVYNSAKHLLSLITDVIDISKIEAGRIDIFAEEFFLTEVVDEAIINIQPQLKEKSLKLLKEIPEDLVLTSDRKRLLQCIINYLSNAVKYTETGTVKIEAEKLDEKIRISVSDTGIGISKEDQKRLFEAFERFESKLKVKAGGTGLGLYLTQKLAREILKGEVKMESELNMGSTFTLLLPLRIESSVMQEE